MKVNELIKYCQESNIQLWVNNGRLGYRSLRGSVPEEILSGFKSNKREIMEFLEKENNVFHDEEGRYSPFPLSDMQSAYFVGSSNNYFLGGVNCHTYMEFRMETIDINKFEEAWHKTIDKHDMLRAVISKEGMQAVQKNPQKPPLVVNDFSSMSSQKALECYIEIRKEMSEKKYEAEEWPLHNFQITILKEFSVVHFSVNMIIADYISINIILNDVMKYYKDTNESMKENGITFRDIIVDKKLQKENNFYSEKYNSDKEYWSKKIETMPEAPVLPIHRDISNHNVRYNRLRTIVEKNRWIKIKELANRNRITPSSFVLTIYAEVIRRWSVNKEFCINITLMDRTVKDKVYTDIVGDFTSVNVLSISNEKLPFIEKAKKIQNSLIEDIEHNSFSGVEVLRELSRRKDKDIIIPYVFTSTIGIDDVNGSDASDGERVIESFDIIHGITQTPQTLLDCQVLENNGSLEINWDYREGGFIGSVIEDMQESFQKIFNELSDGLLEDDQVFYAPVPDRTMIKREKINATKREFPNQMLYDGFLFYLKNTPDSAAIIYEDKKYSYYELGLYVSTVYNELKKMGIKPGDFAAVIQPKGVWQIAAVLASLLAGAAFVPIDHEQPYERKNRIIKSLNDFFVIADDDNASNLVDLKKVINVQELKINTALAEFTRMGEPADTAYIIYTSGSTGEPKGVSISHESAFNTIYDINQMINVKSDDVFFAVSKLSFDLSIYDIFGCFAAGGSLVMPKDKVDPSYFHDLIKRYSISIWNSVPAIFKMLMNEAKEEGIDEINSMKTILLSGDKISREIPKSAKEIFKNADIISLGGATEAAIWSIYYNIKDFDENKNIPYGYPLSNQEFYIMDENMLPCPDWAEGEICIGGKGLAQNYHNDPVLTERKFLWNDSVKKRLYQTGDVGFYTSDGVIEICGRMDDQIKINGHRIELGEIEAVISKHPDVKEAAAAVADSGAGTKKLLAFIVLNEFYNEDSLSKSVQDKLKLNIEQLAESRFAGIDKILLKEWMNLANNISLLEILNVFQDCGLFTELMEEHSVIDIHLAVRESSGLANTVDRMLIALKNEGFIRYTGDKYCLVKKIDVVNEKSDLWNKFEGIENELNYSRTFFDYFKASCNCILQQLRGEKNSLDLFFPQGSTQVALSAYRNNLYNDKLNKITADAVLSYINELESDDKTVRILEIGAGVGGTTKEVVNAVKDINVEYYFTDISKFFLNNAKKEFAEYDFIKYKLFDINADNTEEVFSNKFDIIISANVLHNSENIPHVLKKLNSALNKQGVLIIIDATKESYSLLTSLELKGGLKGFTDRREKVKGVFLNESEWIEELNSSRYNVLCSIPGRDDILSEAGQSIIIAAKISENMSSHEKISGIEAYIAWQLPKYMNPDKMIPVDSIPLTSNGKVDRKKLLTLFNTDKEKAKENQKIERPRNLMEKEILNIWKEVLEADEISTYDNFYAVGGDSLLIAQVVAKIKKTIPELYDTSWDAIMKIALDNPTISGIANAIQTNLVTETQTDLKTQDTKSLKFMTLYNKPNDKNEIIQAYFHTGTGRLIDYEGMIKNLLGQDEDVFNKRIVGFMYGDEEEYTSVNPGELVTTLALKYAEALMDLNAAQYELVGYCVGGFIALEAGRILMEHGKNVSKVILISSHLCLHNVDNELLMEYAYGSIIGANMKELGFEKDAKSLKRALSSITNGEHKNITNNELISLSGEFKGFSEAFGRLYKLSHEQRLALMYESMPSKNFNGEKSTISMLNILYRIFYHTFKGMINYRPRTFAGDVLVLNPEEEVLTFYPDTAEDLEWNCIALGNLDVYQIPGSHATCVDADHFDNILPYLIRRW